MRQPVHKKSTPKQSAHKKPAGRESAAPAHKQARVRQAWLKMFIWIFIAIFLLGSVGAVALIAFH
jgi:hypothetical protein